MATIRLNGATFYYELHGSGQPLVFISGYASDHSQWLTILDNFVKSNYQVLLFDNRGCGKTTDDGTRLTLDLMAQDTMALIEALNLSKPYIVGSSMGGTIAQAIAINYGHEISKLALICTTSKWRQAVIYGLKALLTLKEHNADPMTIIYASFARLFGEKFLSNKKAVNELAKLVFEDPYPQLVADQLRQFDLMQYTDNRENIKNIITPTLIISGREDILCLPYEVQDLLNHIPNSKLVELDCGHVPLLEAKTELINTLQDFFN